MAWRDRLRRRTAAPDTADRTGAEHSGAASNGSRDSGPEPGTSGRAGSAVPGDWDGGWRRTAAPQLTVARAPLGVSDGLAFRAGLASWQNPSFDSSLGHAMLPTAPTGLVRGVTRPAAPQATHAGGGPLLLRALRPEGAGESADGTPGAGPSAAPARPSRGQDAPVVARSGGNSAAGTGSSGKTAPRTRGLTATDSPAVLPSSSAPVQRTALPGNDPVVTPAPPAPPAPPADTGRTATAPEIPLVRRVSVLPVASAGAGGVAPGPASKAPSGSVSGGRTQPEATRPAVRTTPAGPALTAARRPSGPVRRVAALRPTAPAAPGNGTAAPVQRAAAVEPSRAPLGSGQGEPPSPAAPLAADASVPPAPSGPALPVVQRQADGAAGATGTTGADTTRPHDSAANKPGQGAPDGTRVRGGLGAPLSALPPSADVAGSSAPGSRSTGPAPAPAPPVVQRLADGAAGTPRPHDNGVKGTAHSAPDGARVRGGLGAPLSALPPSADVAGSSAPGSRSTGPAPAPAPPVVQRLADGADGARVRGGLGAPLSALPPSAGPPSATASGALTAPTTSGPALPIVQRQADGTPDARQAPAQQDRNTPSTPLPPKADHGQTHTGTAPGTEGPDAPLLGATDVQRRLADHSSTGAPSSPAPADHGSTSATPLVTPAPAASTGAGGTENPAATVRPPGVRVGGQRPRVPASPSPVVVARAVAPTSAGGDRPGTAHPLTVTHTGAHSAQAAPLTRPLQLLPARPLLLSTRTPEGATPPAAARSGRTPVVAARWPGAPAAHQGDAARPSPSTPTTPQVQRAASAPAGRDDSGIRGVGPVGSSSGSPGSLGVPGSPASPGSPGSPGGSASLGSSASPAFVQRVPVVRPASAGLPTGAAPAVAARPLPVTAPQAPPLAERPPNAAAPVQAVPVVRAVRGGNGAAATPVQRDATDGHGAALSKGGPAKAARAHGRSRSASTSAASGTSGSASGSASRKGGDRRSGTPQDPGVDLDDLARRLLDPMARLLRTELRRGRERTGRPYDGRR
ncbi:hypothetical protein OG895_20615 [Streptomyces sp. NBC_00201]|uniref:hypothetical protein n=1 Tax=Streptomyces sp. NBC_00201 TaxID=2975679 RepID=UPI0022560AC7|nr:hypothetical protein [Streptomyces sp. NBC_00201]MCX5247583.1 hypothetical protein [Streptomyces sp. NBC_00201]